MPVICIYIFSNLNYLIPAKAGISSFILIATTFRSWYNWKYFPALAASFLPYGLKPILWWNSYPRPKGRGNNDTYPKILKNNKQFQIQYDTISQFCCFSISPLNTETKYQISAGGVKGILPGYTDTVKAVPADQDKEGRSTRLVLDRRIHMPCPLPG